MSPPKKTQESSGHGEKLSRYLERVWQQLGTTRGAWCREHRIADSTVLRWSAGVEPDMRNYRLVAAALGIDLLDVLVIAGEIDAKPGARPSPPAFPKHTCRLDTALAEDTGVPEWRRQFLAATLRELNKLQLGPRRRAPEPDPPVRAVAADLPTSRRRGRHATAQGV